LFLPAQPDAPGGGAARGPAGVPVTASATPTIVTRRAAAGDGLTVAGDAARTPDGQGDFGGPTATAGTRPARATTPGALTGTPTRTPAIGVSATATPAPSRTIARVFATATAVPLVATATPPPPGPPPPEPTDEPEDPPPTPDDAVVPGAIAGRVTGEDGRPIADAEVEAMPAGPRGGPGRHPAHARTDADGRYRIEGLRPGAYHVSAEPPGRMARRWFRDARDPRDAEEVFVTPGATTEGIDIRFPRRLDRDPRDGHGGNPPPPLPTPAEPTPTATPAAPTPTVTSEAP